MILGLNMDWVVRVGWIQTSRPAVEVDGITGNMGYGWMIDRWEKKPEKMEGWRLSR